MVIFLNFTPDYKLVLAPKENSFHLRFSSFDKALTNVVLINNNESDLLSDYLFIKKYIEEYDFDNPKVNSNGVLINTKELLFSFILESFSFVYFISPDTEFSYFFPDNKNFGKNISCCVFSICLVEDELECTSFSVTSTKLHNAKLNFCGEVKTNNKTSRWSWGSELTEDFFYTVSLWLNSKIYKIFDTNDNFFVLSDHLVLEEGEFDLIVVTKDKFGSSSDPSLFKFKLKTSFIVDSVSVFMINEDGDKVDVSSNSNPTFRITNFSPENDYILNFDNVYKFSYKDSLKSGKLLFYNNVSENALEFTIPEKLSTGNHNLNLSIVDEINNVYGDDFLAPIGEHGTHFLFFFVADTQSEKPELLRYQWNTDGSLLLSWKSDDLSKSFDVYQGNTFLKNTIETICIVEPVIDKKLETVLTVIPYGYDGKASNNTMTVTVKKPIITISNFKITLKDAIVLDEKYYTNNPCPTFSWGSTYSTESIANYMVSLDGSNWFGINSKEFTFERLKDGDYTFRLKAVFTDKTYTRPDLNVFNFTLKTNLPSYPIFSRETLNNFQSTFKNLYFSWSEIFDINHYKLIFNDGEYETQVYNTNYYIPATDSNIKLKTGWNTVSLFSVSKFGNVSKATKFSFLVTNEETVKKTQYYSPISFEPFYSLKLDLFGSKKVYDYVIKDPDGLIFETFKNGPLNFLKNSKTFVKNGIYTYDVFFEGEKAIDTFYYNYNSYSFKIDSLLFDGEFIKWSINNPAITPLFEYSFCLEEEEFNTWTRCKTFQTPSLSGYSAGTYKFSIKSYSFDGTLQEIKELTQIKINSLANFSLEKIAVPGFANVFLNILFYKKSNCFIINSVEKDGAISDCFLQFKSVDENVYKLYELGSKKILDSKKMYDFLINFIEGVES